jgi:hypothetical protein
VRTGSNFAAYWLWFIFQDWSGDINVAKSLTESAYSETQPHILAQQGTKFSVVPLSTNFTRINDSSYGIFYQNSNGKLAVVIPGNYTGGSGTITQSWPSSRLQSILLFLPNSDSCNSISVPKYFYARRRVDLSIIFCQGQ